MHPWLLLIAQVALFSVFPFGFALLPPALRTTLFYAYVSVLLVTAGVLGAVFALPLTPTMTITFGGIAYSATIMATMLMFLVAHDLRVVRNAIRLVVVVNLFVVVVLALVSTALATPGVIDSFGTSAEVFRVPILAALIGGLLNILQLVLMAVALERLPTTGLARWPLLLAHIAVFLGVLAIDGALFPTLLVLVEPGFELLLADGLAGVLAKLQVGVLFAVPLAGFLVAFRHRLATFQAPRAPLRELFVAPRDELLARIEEQRSHVRERERLLRLASQAAQLGGWELRADDGRMIWSPEALALLGHAEPGPQHLDDALERHPPGSREVLQVALERCLREGTTVDLELPATTADGGSIWTRIVAEPHRQSDGHIDGLVGAIQDITERRATQQEADRLARRLSDTLEAMTDGLVILDERGRFTYVNRSAERAFGAPRDDLLGQNMAERFPEQPSDSAFHRAYHRAFVKGEPQRIVAFSEPLQRWIEAEGYPSDLGLVVYFRDVTDRVEREQQLESIAAAEQAAADRLRHLNQVKDTFLTAVSHELRTPLTVVLGMAQTLQRLRHEEVSTSRARMEDALVDNAERLAELLDDLLDIDRLSRDALRIEPVGFDLVARASALVADSPIASRIHVKTPDQLDVTADPVRCERILHNLLDNAAKYAPDGDVEVRLSRLGERGATIEVRDQGPGIPAGERDQVFEPFHRSDPDHPQPGTGIGLALVAEFAALHGGRAYAHDTGGEGAHLVVELPGGDQRSGRRAADQMAGPHCATTR